MIAKHPYPPLYISFFRIELFFAQCEVTFIVNSVKESFIMNNLVARPQDIANQNSLICLNFSLALFCLSMYFSTVPNSPSHQLSLHSTHPKLLNHNSFGASGRFLGIPIAIIFFKYSHNLNQG